MAPLDRTFHLAEQQLGQTEFRVASTIEDLKACCRLVHNEYVRRGYMKPQPNQLKVSLFHALPSTTTFLAQHPVLGLLGTVTLIEDSPLGLPTDTVHAKELAALRRKEHYLAEASMFALNSRVLTRSTFPTLRTVQLALILRLFKVLFDYLRSCTPTTELVASFTAKHAILYDCLHFEPLSGPKPYPAVNGTLGIARHLNVTQAQCLAALEPITYFFFSQQESSLRFVNKLVLSTKEMLGLCTEAGLPLASAGARELDYIRSCYPLHEELNDSNELRTVP